MSVNWSLTCAESNKDCPYIIFMAYRIFLDTEIARYMKISEKSTQNFSKNYGVWSLVAPATIVLGLLKVYRHNPARISDVIVKKLFMGAIHETRAKGIYRV